MEKMSTKDVEAESDTMLENTMNSLTIPDNQTDDTIQELIIRMVKLVQQQQEFRQQQQELVQRLQEQQHQIQQVQNDNEIMKRNLSISTGTYFSSLTDTWSAGNCDPDFNVVVDMFDRIHPLEGEFKTGMAMGYYQTTLYAGYDTIAVDESSISSSESSVCSNGTHFLDIFGDPDCKDNNVHLMPASSCNAEQWSVIVPGVLSSIVRERTDKMNCFIHGFRKASPNDSSKKNSRVDKSGIKHFATNMIRLKGQCQQHFDRNHCVLIIPILSCTEIKEWSGNGYDAIVLADGNNIYRKIGADTDAMSKLDTCILANAADIETCRTVLTDLIRVVFKSFNTNTKLEERIDFSRLKIPLAIDSKNTVPKVRKIHFSSRIGRCEDHPRAPDPMLLLSNAVSNWLHRHGLMTILPVPLIENESTLDSGSQYSYDNAENGSLMKSNSFDHSSAGSSRHLADSQCSKAPVVDIAFVNDYNSSVALCSDMHGVADSTMGNAYNGIPDRSISPSSSTSEKPSVFDN